MKLRYLPEGFFLVVKFYLTRTCFVCNEKLQLQEFRSHIIKHTFQLQQESEEFDYFQSD